MASVKYDTILSNFEGKLTLMQWLKACDASLKTLTEDFSDMREDVDGLRHDLDETQEFDASLNQRLSAVEIDVDALQETTSSLDTRVTALENAPAGGGLFKHQLHGLTSTMDNISYIIDGDATPITASNFISRMLNALVIQGSTRQPFTNYCSQNGEYSASMTWQSGANAFSAVTITFQNVSDSVTAL